MWNADDRAALIDPDMPGYAQAVKADLSTVDGLFRRPSDQAFGLVRGNNPVFLCNASQAPARQATLTIHGDSYRVVGVDPDGNGFARLDLEQS